MTVWDCCGRILEWSGHSPYSMIPAPDGHVDIDVPPGKYIIRAGQDVYFCCTDLWGNDWTDHGVVTVGCGDTKCVTLYSPSVSHCGWGWLEAVKVLDRARLIPRELAQNAIRAGDALLEHLPGSNFEKATREAMLQLLKGAEKVKPAGGKKKSK